VKVNNNNNEGLWPFRKINYLIFGIGMLLIIVGYLLMGYGSVDSVLSVKVAPFFLFVGYIIFIPIAILYNK
tara:strand:+ start:3948 stop:4160 length:213 start_codon:yes stop_codon:yes gene_type:complete